MARKTNQPTPDPDPFVSNDQPTLLDCLDNIDLIKEIGQQVEHCHMPQVFGVHGDWGAGKTSLLHQLHYYLTGDCPLYPEKLLKEIAAKKSLPKSPFATSRRNQARSVVVWFEAWKYQYEEVPLVALLHEIRNQLDWYRRTITQGKKTLTVAAKSLLLSIEDITSKIGLQATGIKASTIQNTGEAWEKEHLASKLPADNIRQMLQHAIDGLLNNNTKSRRRLVVLIDDLDRCEPAAAYKLLEGLKIYLTLNNTVFVLGMNQRIVEDAIGQNISVATVPRAEKEIVRKERSAAYMEKICQNFWRVPLVANPVQVMLNFFSDLPDSDRHIPALKRAFTEDATIGQSSPEFIQCLPPNPRRLKAYSNLLYRFTKRLPDLCRDKTELADDEIRQIRRMLVTASIYQFHHDVYRRWAHEPGLIEQIRIWAEARDESTLDEKDRKSTKFGRLFPHVKRVAWGVAPKDVNQPVPTRAPMRYQTSYPDPAESTVFWIQPMIYELGNIDPQQFAEFLNIR